jgi:anti-sigma-K factor RskA
MAEGDMHVMPMNDGPDTALFMNATFAVSLEPEGGSPTGSPTGPVLFSGKLFKSTP